MKKEEHILSIDLCRHYIVNNGWFEEDQLLKKVDVIRHIPATIVQGRLDTITPMKAAWELHKVSVRSCGNPMCLLWCICPYRGGQRQCFIWFPRLATGT